jgi:hypothetical protein
MAKMITSDHLPKRTAFICMWFEWEHGDSFMLVAVLVMFDSCQCLLLLWRLPCCCIIASSELRRVGDDIYNILVLRSAESLRRERVVEHNISTMAERSRIACLGKRVFSWEI